MAFIPVMMAAAGAAAGTAGTMATIATVASAGIGAVSAIMQGQQTKAANESAAQAADYNAKVSQARAEEVQSVASIQQDEQRRKARQTIGTQLASSAEAGGGLNGNLVRQSVFDMEGDTNAIRYDANMKAAGLNDQAALDTFEAGAKRRQGSAAVTGSYLSAAGAIANAGMNYYTRGTAFPTTKLNGG